jgi:hypothetical protein
LPSGADVLGKKKSKKGCCGKYLKSGRHCKGCPLLLTSEEAAPKEKKKVKKKDKEKKGQKKK